MKYHKLSVAVTGTSKRNQIFSALQIQFLREGDLLTLALFFTFDICLFIHGVRSGNLNPLQILDRKRIDRLFDLLVEIHLHANRKGAALHQGIGDQLVHRDSHSL